MYPQSTQETRLASRPINGLLAHLNLSCSFRSRIKLAVIIGGVGSLSILSIVILVLVLELVLVLVMLVLVLLLLLLLLLSSLPPLLSTRNEDDTVVGEGGESSEGEEGKEDPLSARLRVLL